MESCKNSKEVLKTLLRLSDNFDLDANDIPEAVLKLCDHFKTESESAVRVKILSILSDIGQEPQVDVLNIIDETVALLKNEVSHKVIAQGLNTLLKLGKTISDSLSLHSRLVDIAKYYLKDVNHAVKCKCLEMIGVFTPVNQGTGVDKILDLVCSYHNNDDARVRSQSFHTVIVLHERGLKLNAEIYGSICAALKDDYEIVRQVVLKLICLLGNAYPEQ